MQQSLDTAQVDQLTLARVHDLIAAAYKNLNRNLFQALWQFVIDK